MGPSPLGTKTAVGAGGSSLMGAVPEERPQRARRAAVTKITYVISSSSDDDVVEKDSDFEVSD